MLKGKRVYFVFLLFIFSIILYACSNDESLNEETYHTAEDGDVGVVEEREMVDHSEEAEEQSSAADYDEPVEHNQSRMVIYTGRLSVEVPNFDEAERRLTNQIELRNGYIVEASQYEHEDDFKTGSIVARIPEEQFHDFMNNIEGEHTVITEKSIQGQDVTEEYVDLESRLRSKEAVEERLLNFLDEAESTDDLLAVSNDLSRVQEEIEQLKGRMDYLENHSSYSTVHINIQEQRIDIPEIQDQNSLNTIERAQQLLMNTLNVLINVFSQLFVFTIGLSPILIPLTAIALFIILKRKKQNNTE
ncbi:DUF4349 domain-containing protein [Alkalibacillus haloalkaliphilus]|uniref:DUF4349 domain-containing protein n=1 Tax=Alkalibacillus haloalkaliphilus TaxID=94136 RepID=UPI0029367610|nr:DUF4349 domain-containing protein [Alkalibacillus haloalkaliphilus]MDV2582459.1 DUF4349 domain-containing protein [Alkalibacillus haloalkaliphilus]